MSDLVGNPKDRFSQNKTHICFCLTLVLKNIKKKDINFCIIVGHVSVVKVIEKHLNRNWSYQKANPALKTKAGNK